MTAATNLNYADVASIIQGRPAASMARLPAIWHAIAEGTAATVLSATIRADYVEAARLFRHHGTALAMEALDAIGHDFTADAYPAFDSYIPANAVQQKTLDAVRDIFVELGYAAGASLYHVLLDTAFRPRNDELMTMFKDKAELMRDRVQDAVLHASLLVTPVGLYIQSVFSQHGLRFLHVMNCGCGVAESSDAPFAIALDPALKPAYLQNMVAASLEQYGVNAATSRMDRGF